MADAMQASISSPFRRLVASKRLLWDAWAICTTGCSTIDMAPCLFVCEPVCVHPTAHTLLTGHMHAGRALL
jgi:hypothetical protein